MSVVVAGYARTPFARYTGALASVPAVELGAAAVRAALVRAGVEPHEVERVVAGQVLQGGAGQNPARQAAVAAGMRVFSYHGDADSEHHEHSQRQRRDG